MTYQWSAQACDKARASSHDALRRAFDIVVAVVALVVLAPFMAAIALAILLEGGAPVFYRQVRLGQNGRPFEILKFRKFHATCGSDGSPLTFDGDARMTRIGRFLRATKLDELPQFWNVLKGDMAIIGPRPESMPFADCFCGPYARVLDFRPGILGPSQVAFRNESALYADASDADAFYRAAIFPAKARIDLDYYPGRTLLSDVVWLVRGGLAVLGFRSRARTSEGAGATKETRA